jgi:hypothetical protein
MLLSWQVFLSKLVVREETLAFEAPGISRSMAYRGI